MIMEKVSIFVFSCRSLERAHFSELIDFHCCACCCLTFSGFPHLPGIPTSQAHLTGTPDWRVLNNRPFPPSQYFHHHPHFATHNVLAAIDRMERPFLDGSKCSAGPRRDRPLTFFFRFSLNRQFDYRANKAPDQHRQSEKLARD